MYFGVVQRFAVEKQQSRDLNEGKNVGVSNASCSKSTCNVNQDNNKTNQEQQQKRLQ
jgi:hypothetical protein